MEESQGYLTPKATRQLRRWADHFVGDADMLSLRIFETCFTASFLLWMGKCFLTWREWLTDQGFHLTAPELAGLGFPEPFPLLDGRGVVVLAAVIAVSGVALMANLRRRLALLGLFACAVYVQGADNMSAFTLNKLYVAVYGILLITPGISREKDGTLRGSILAVRVIQSTLLLQYLAAGTSKAFSGDWLKYHDVLYTQVQGVYRTDLAALMLRVTPVWMWTVFQWISLLFELEAPVLFCIRKLRPIAFVVGISFHLVIALLMKDLIYFSFQMWTFYILFISPDEWRRMAKKAGALWEAARTRLCVPGQGSRPLPAGSGQPGFATEAVPAGSHVSEKDMSAELAVNIGRSGKLPRRLILSAAGVTLALPFLESVSERLLAGRKGFKARPGPTNDRPMRMVCIGNAFGFYQPAFWPKQAGRNYQLPALLQPLAPHQNDFTLFSGLDHGLKGGHWAVSAYLSGVRTIDAKSLPDHNVTIDQLAAETVGGKTRFPSLTVGSEGGLLGGCMMSWTRAGNRVPPIPGPKELFRRLFVSDSEKERAEVSDRLGLQESILDTIGGNAKILKRQLGKDDVEKLDEFFTSMRDVEKQLEMGRNWSAVPKPTPTVEEPEDKGFVPDLPVLYDLIALALQTDSTRIATLEIAGGFEATTFGLKRDYHALSHHGQLKENIEGLLVLEAYQVKQFARFLEKLKGIREADGTLLDQSMVLFGSGMANANAHTNYNLPIILGGGGFKHGEHRQYSMIGTDRQPLCNLYATMLQRFGLEVSKFGNGRGTLAGFS